ncbi:hypothetical protein M011DRAFT_482479 [Sporormia fimetaria CBS 119925]|uniref:Zn(2)-C6 fungal-type domain-containing protein n=1 Tax=Sporormia fimetaria CBS 119925 TaxID=1340428 RepID=A0A6A6VR02_9PLEO|nr:hypothetical protein M011DRAFT_482479 [Sporormia fimetaria CBS 119925]
MAPTRPHQARTQVRPSDKRPARGVSIPNENGVRKRVGKACDRCRVKKSKCDGLSFCGRCQADNLVCSYGERKQNTDKGHPKGYAEMLEHYHGILIQALQLLYHIAVKGEPFKELPLQAANGTQPYTQHILEAVGISLQSPPGDDNMPPTFFEDPKDIHAQCKEREKGKVKAEGITPLQPSVTGTPMPNLGVSHPRQQGRHRFASQSAPMAQPAFTNQTPMAQPAFTNQTPMVQSAFTSQIPVVQSDFTNQTPVAQVQFLSQNQVPLDFFATDFLQDHPEQLGMHNPAATETSTWLPQENTIDPSILLNPAPAHAGLTGVQPHRRGAQGSRHSMGTIDPQTTVYTQDLQQGYVLAPQPSSLPQEYPAPQASYTEYQVGDSMFQPGVSIYDVAPALPTNPYARGMAVVEPRKEDDDLSWNNTGFDILEEPIHFGESSEPKSPKN